MSGHSKWSKIKHKKGAADAKRGAAFTRLGNAITVAAKKGGDPDMNFSLRLAIDKAKASNMPKENIQRSIKRGTGESGSAQLEEITYEGFLPAGRQVGQKTPIIIETLTDNKNRTVAEIKHILEKSGGVLAGPGSVMWMFEKKGIIEMRKETCLPAGRNSEIEGDELELQLIDLGAEDIEMNDEILIYTKPEDLKKVKDNLAQENIPIKEASLELVAKEKVDVSDEVGEKLQKLFDTLDKNDDVANYYTNLK